MGIAGTIATGHKKAHETFFNSELVTFGFFLTIAGVFLHDTDVEISQGYEALKNTIQDNVYLTQLHILIPVLLPFYFLPKIIQLISNKIMPNDKEHIDDNFTFYYNKSAPIGMGVMMIWISAMKGIMQPGYLSSPDIYLRDALVSHPMTLALGALMLFSGIVYCAWSSTTDTTPTPTH